MSYKPYVHHGVELERAIIGACLIEQTAFGRVRGLVDEECFYADDHKKVFSAMDRMFTGSVPIDLHTVTYELTQAGAILSGGNIPFVLARCMTEVVSTAHLEYHCHLVREMWKRREIIRIRTTYPEDGGFDTASNIRDISEQIDKITSGKIQSEWKDMSEILYDLIVYQNEVAAGRKTMLTTGFKALDQKNGGFYEGQLVVVGARPSVGKSALMGKMAIEMARSGKKVGIISLEMNNKEIAARLASLDTEFNYHQIYRAMAHDEQMHRRFYDQISGLINLPIYLSDKTRVNITDIRAKAMKLRNSYGLDCLMVDYLQLVDSNAKKGSNREQEVAGISRGMKLLAHELEIPVVLLVQLNRAVTQRGKQDRYPRLSDIRESGAIEQDADVVMFIHRDYMLGIEVDENGMSTERKADLLAQKWRNGAPCRLELGFDPERMNFFEIGHQTDFRPMRYNPAERVENADDDDLPF